MTSWMEERDRLVAQTQAFVQQVAAAHPKESARPPVEQPPVETSAVETAPIKAAMPDLPAPRVPADIAPVTVAAAPARLVGPVVSERSDIQSRVAAFRARQARMNEEREAYNQTMQAKIRKQLGNEAGTSRL